LDGVNFNIVTMTSWLPDLSRFAGPRYRAIAEALAADIREGRLTAGTRLPTHRDLAWRLHVTVGTVSRAYAEAERRGLIGGEVGRGTFVREPVSARVLSFVRPEPERADFIDFSFNYPIVGDEAPALAAVLARLAGSNDLDAFLHYSPSAGRPADRAAGAAWMARSGLETGAERVVLANGGQHALATVLSALTRAGDVIATECLTYPGMRALANLLDLRLVGLTMDEDGLLPDAFEAACRGGAIKALYTMPTLHNPTTAIMPEERRRAVAAIARRHGVAIVEDDVYGFLLDAQPVPIANLVPELGFFIGSTSKSMAPGLRIGYVHAPLAWIDRLAAAMRATTYMATPLMAEIASLWINDGVADALVAAKRRAATTRRRVVETALAGARFRSHPAAFHLLLSLPDAWHADDFAAEARRRGVGLTQAAAFAVGRGSAPNAVRLCFGTPASDTLLERGLRIVTDLLAEAPQQADLAVI
jgi:DNA-binding transcriptional MocR family regulator